MKIANLCQRIYTLTVILIKILTQLFTEIEKKICSIWKQKKTQESKIAENRIMEELPEVPLCFIRSALWPELAKKARLTGHQTLEILLSLPSHCWDYKLTSSCSVFRLSSVFHAVWQALYQLIFLPSLYLFFWDS